MRGALFVILSLVSTAASAQPDEPPEWQSVTPLRDGRFVGCLAQGGATRLVVGERASATLRTLADVDADFDGCYTLTGDGGHALIRRDAGHKRQASIFSVPLDGGPLTPLTSAPLDRFIPFAPAKRPELMVYEVRKHDQPGSFVYVQPLDVRQAARLAFHDPRLGWLRDVSADGRQALLFRFVSLSQRELWRVDLDGTAKRRLYPPEGRVAAIHSARFSPDGNRVYVAVDEGARPLLLALDAHSGRELARYVEPGGELGGVTVSPDGKWLAASARIGVRAALRLLDASTLTTRPLAATLPTGIDGPLAFSPDSRQIGVGWATPNEPARAWFIDVATGATTPLNGATPPSALDVSTVELRARDGLTIPTLVYRPHARAGKLPVVVFLHGGPTGAALAEYDWRWRWLADNGFAVVTPNIRGSSGFGRTFEEADDGPRRPRSFDDLADVADWIARQPWADGRKLIVYGQSYGGYLTLVALTRQPERWCAGIDAYGISDWRSFFATTNVGTSTMFQNEIGRPGKDDALLGDLSPLGHVDRARAPLFVYHGVNDGQVPVAQSDQVVAAWRRRGLRVDYQRAEGEEHGMEQPATREELARRLLGFLRDVTH